MEVSDDIVGIKTANFRVVARCLNHRMPLLINSVISKFCSLLFYSKFWTLFELLYSAVSVRNDRIFYFLSLIMIISFIDFNVLK